MGDVWKWGVMSWGVAAYTGTGEVRLRDDRCVVCEVAYRGSLECVDL